MTDQIEVESCNVTPPLQNSTGMKCIAVLSVTTASQVVDLAALFGNIGNGHFFTLTADLPANSGSRVYIAFGVNTAGSIDETATGIGATVCYPIPDNQSLPVRLLAGDVRASGIATLALYSKLYYKGLATGYLRIYRSSVGPTQGAKEFAPP